MYHFAVVLLLGLAVLKVVDLLEEVVPSLTRIHTLLTFFVSIAGAVSLGYSLFGGFDVPLRSTWMGTWTTGVVIASLASAWRAALAYLGHRDGADAERGQPGRPRVAA